MDAEFDEESHHESGLAVLNGGGTVQRTQTSYTTAIAVQRPRNKKELQKAAVEEAGLAGEDFFYAWTVKGKDGKKELVEGTSIDGAMIMARNWGNCAQPIGLEGEAPQHWLFRAAFVDLETGFNTERLFRQRKSQRTGKMDAERALDIALQIGQSKAIRNVTVKALPKWLIESCMEAAKAAAEGKYKDVPKQTPKFLKRFAELGVTQEQLERKLGRTIDKWEPRDLMTLAAIGRAIADRQTTVEEEFSEEEAQGNPKPDAAPKEDDKPRREDDGTLDQDPPTSDRQPGEDG